MGDIIENNEWQRYPYGKTIMALFEHQKLKVALENWANDNGCLIRWVRSHSELYAVGGFVHIIDRRMLEEEEYDYYLQWCKGEMDVNIVEVAVVKKNGEREIICANESENYFPVQKVGMDCKENEACENYCIFVDGAHDKKIPKTLMVNVISQSMPMFVECVINNVNMARKTAYERIYKRCERL